MAAICDVATGRRSSALHIIKGKRTKKLWEARNLLHYVKRHVMNYFNENADKTDQKRICEDDIFVVWSCKTLQNHKALLSTTVSDGMYYELTYNGDKREMYFDAYKKWQNICFEVKE